MKIKKLTRSDKIRHTKIYHEAVDPLVEHLTKPEWDEVVNDKFVQSTRISLFKNDLECFIFQYLASEDAIELDVRIKCRKGCIQIERVK